MLRLALQLVSLLRGTLRVCGLLLTLPMDSELSLVPWMVPSMCGIHLHMSQPNPLPLTQHIPIFMRSQTQMVGSKTHRVAYYIGYPHTVVQVCIRPLS